LIASVALVKQAPALLVAAQHSRGALDEVADIFCA